MFAVTLVKCTNPKLFWRQSAKNYGQPTRQVAKNLLQNVPLYYKKLTATSFMNLLELFFFENFID